MAISVLKSIVDEICLARHNTELAEVVLAQVQRSGSLGTGGSITVLNWIAGDNYLMSIREDIKIARNFYFQSPIRELWEVWVELETVVGVRHGSGCLFLYSYIALLNIPSTGKDLPEKPWGYGSASHLITLPHVERRASRHPALR